MTEYPEHLACVGCGALLVNMMEGEGIQPMRGLAFSTGGHYGSSVFDPMDGSRIQIVVCDECLRAKGYYPSDKPRDLSGWDEAEVIRIADLSDDEHAALFAEMEASLVETEASRD